MLEAQTQVALEALIALPVGVFFVDEEDHIRQANPAAHALLGVTSGELEGLALIALTGGQPIAADAQRITVTAATHRLELLLRELPITCIPLRRVVTVVDPAAVDPRKGMRLPPLPGLDASRLDVDTGLLNRRNVLQELNAQVSRSRRYGNVLSVLHLSLPAALAPELRRSLAQALKATLRWVDIIGRWEDDALLVILPETSHEAASVLARKLREVMQQVLGDCVPNTVGVAQWARGEEATALVARAAAESCELARAG